MDTSVRATRARVPIPTYPTGRADPNPLFFERRINQLSDGNVYPLPFTDTIACEKVDREYDAVVLENEFVSLMILPELGGRVHMARDKTNGYDFVYHNTVIKPALIGLAGPWISGGMEFNWPQHHRPTTFGRLASDIQENADGGITVWVGEVEPLYRMKGMVGITLHPGRSVIELKVRLYNRTTLPQTFLWWLNMGVYCGDDYQVFFPPDITHVWNHAKLDVMGFPIAHERYGGAAANDFTAGVDISRQRNIAQCASYFAIGSRYDWFGGYDHTRGAGLVYVGDHHISTAKKMFTWGNSPFADAWINNLTDACGPYLELMAGAYSDNQPDFSWIQPGETKSFSQFVYPIRGIGPADGASVEAAASLVRREGRWLLGCATTSVIDNGSVTVSRGGAVLFSEEGMQIAPNAPYMATPDIAAGEGRDGLTVTIRRGNGSTAASFDIADRSPPGALPAAYRAPATPASIVTVEELYLQGLHLQQYRHPTWRAEPYYQEALRRDPFDSRTNVAIGLSCLRNAQFEKACSHFLAAIQRLTMRNPNPQDTQTWYCLGLAHEYQGRYDEACDAYHKAAWGMGVAATAYYRIALIDCRRGRYEAALAYCGRSLDLSASSNSAIVLQCALLRRLQRADASMEALKTLLRRDPLDFLASHELLHALQAQGRAGDARAARAALHARCGGDAQVSIDAAEFYLAAGMYEEARDALVSHAAHADGQTGVSALVYYYLAYVEKCDGRTEASMKWLALAAGADDYCCFPSRVESVPVLESAVAAKPDDARARHLLAMLLYYRKQRDRAMGLWEELAASDRANPVVLRALGIACVNVRHDTAQGRSWLCRAVAADGSDGRILVDLVQLLKRTGTPALERLALLEKHRDLVFTRDDLVLELTSGYIAACRYEDALAILSNRTFHPWEGGFGAAIACWEACHYCLGAGFFRDRDYDAALREFDAALALPPQLGEGRMAAPPVGRFLVGRALTLDAQGRSAEALDLFRQIAGQSSYDPENLYYQAVACRQCDDEAGAKRCITVLETRGREFHTRLPQFDYFAFGSPFYPIYDPHDLIEKTDRRNGAWLLGLAAKAAGDAPAARKLFRQTLTWDPEFLKAQWEIDCLALPSLPR